MGVPGFFWYIRSKYPMAVEKVDAASILSQCDNLFIDLNAVTHSATHGTDDNPVTPSDEIVQARLMKELDTIIMLLNPQKFIYFSVDGTVPRSKMNQQRDRRFVAGKKRVAQMKESGSEDLFDANSISPGTAFMERVNKMIEYYISVRLSTDPAWKKLTVLYSSYHCPGEGEHKIMNYLRESIKTGAFSDNDHNVIYGSDADLILLAMTMHKKNVSVMRQADVYGPKNPVIPRQVSLVRKNDA